MDCFGAVRSRHAPTGIVPPMPKGNRSQPFKRAAPQLDGLKRADFLASELLTENGKRPIS
jgi:hypothetical protein